MIKTLSTLIIMLFACTNVFAQVSGNQVYKKKYGDNDRALNSFYATDSTLIISVNVLLNQEADKYMLTLGVSQEGKTPKECLALINQRIDALTSKIKIFGIKKENVFVDFISQTKIYDFDVKAGKGDKGDKAEEIEKGFEMKKNIIISIDKFENIEKIIVEAAENDIYDIVKVDYINENIEGIHSRLLKEANEILDKKKAEYFRLFRGKIIGEARATENFTYNFPKDQYEEYTAFESSEIKNYSSANSKKIARKQKTYFYDGMNYAGYDKVINNANPVVGIQYILNLRVTYDVEKNK